MGEHKVHRAQKDRGGQKDLPVRKVLREYRANLALPVQKALLVLPVLKEISVLRVLLEKQVLLALKALKENREQQALMFR